MNDATINPPRGELRKKRPPVIEHEPPPAPRLESDGPLPWEFDKLGLVIIPGLLTWLHFETLWDTVDGIRQGSMFMVGDALAAGESRFGDQIWNLPSYGYRPETLRNAIWVSRQIPLSRRRRLPWSYHQAIATSKLTAREQDDLLDLAERKKRAGEYFTTDDMKTLVADLLASKKSNRPPRGESVIPPNGREDPEPGAEAAPEPMEPEPEPEEEGSQQDQYAHDDEQPAEAAPVNLAVLSPVEEARACMDAIRAVAADVAIGHYNAIELRELSNRVGAAVGMTPSGWNSNALLSSDVAERMIPGHWRLRIDAFERKEGVRHWQIRAYWQDRLVLADGPVQAICYADVALGTLVSDLLQP